jgi:phosphatidylinositol-3-phosphatase
MSEKQARLVRVAAGRRAKRASAAAVVAALCAWSLLRFSDAAAATRGWRPDHVVVVIMENHSFSGIIDGKEAVFIRDLAARGATFTNSFAVGRPSQPNYFALFSGSTQSVSDNAVYRFDAPTLAGALAKAGMSFAGYVEKGSPRRHNPWESFADSQTVERDFAGFPTDFAGLPTVSFVIPDLDHDMHDGSIATGDRWLETHLGAYAAWCRDHNSLLIVTFDEGDSGLLSDDRIPTIIFGSNVAPGRYDERINHYSVLRMLLSLFRLEPLANTADAPRIGEIWHSP